MDLITKVEDYSFYNREDKALVMQRQNDVVVINSVPDIPKGVRENLNDILEGKGVTTGKDYTSNSTFELLLEIKRAAEEGRLYSPARERVRSRISNQDYKSQQ